MSEAKSALNELAERSEEIGEIVASSTEKLRGQTNLLALKRRDHLRRGRRSRQSLRAWWRMRSAISPERTSVSTTRSAR